MFKKKYSFQNPLRQTYRQKKVLEDFLGINESYISVIVYFVGDCKFKTSLPPNVIRSGLGRYIKSYKELLLSQKDIDDIVNKIQDHISESNLSTRDHVRSLRERHNSNTVCPRCGANLKVKVARKGTKAGSEFLGCENYPRCRFTKSS